MQQKNHNSRACTICNCSRDGKREPQYFPPPLGHKSLHCHVSPTLCFIYSSGFKHPLEATVHVLWLSCVTALSNSSVFYIILLTTHCFCCLSRVRLSGMKIVRPPVAIGHYKMIKHKGDRGNEQNPRRYRSTQTHRKYVGASDFLVYLP